MSFNLSRYSKDNLIGIHPDLIFLAYVLITRTKTDFIILPISTKRDALQQKHLVEKGYSQTNNSYHQYGLALDIVLYIDGKATWDKKHNEKYNEMIKIALEIIKEYNLNITHPLEWDKPHFQMNLNRYSYKRFKNVLPYNR